MELSKEEQLHILNRRAEEALKNAPKPPRESVAGWKATADAIPATRDNGMQNAVNIANQAWWVTQDRRHYGMA